MDLSDIFSQMFGENPNTSDKLFLVSCHNHKTGLITRRNDSLNAFLWYHEYQQGCKCSVEEWKGHDKNEVEKTERQIYLRTNRKVKP